MKYKENQHLKMMIKIIITNKKNQNLNNKKQLIQSHKHN